MLLTLVLILVTLYVAALFAVARYANRSALAGRNWVTHPVIYALSIGVYCTSWTFYGLVGTAAESGWNFLPILIGPILLYVVGFPIIRKIARITREERLTSITDFVASRYGKRKGIALVVTAVVIFATVPYIALQLKAVADSLQVLVGRVVDKFELPLLTSVAMASFALLFGTRTSEKKIYNAGLIVAIAFESLVKLLAMGVVAILALAVLFSEPHLSAPNVSVLASINPNISFFVQMIVSAFMVLCLPRMFHVCFVYNQSDKQVVQSRWLFPLYLVFIIIFIVIIAFVGNNMFAESLVPADQYILAIPLQTGYNGVGTLAFIGGFSAATAMILVSSITVSQIVSNNIIMPFLVERDLKQGLQRDYGGLIVVIRRLTVLMVIFLAYIYQRTLVDNQALTSIGLIAFALAVQLAPAIIGGLYWSKGNAKGAYAGIAVGALTWFYTLFLPLMSRAGLGMESLLIDGPFGLEMLAPENLFGLNYSDSYSMGVIVSVLVNVLTYFVVSRMTTTELIDRIQSQRFTSMESFAPNIEVHEAVPLADLEALLSQFLTADHILKLLPPGTTQVTPEILKMVEQSLAGITGVATARSLIESISQHRSVRVEEVMNIVRDTTRALRFNQDVLYSSFESIPTGISVINKELELIAWNSRYKELFRLPDSMLRVGQPIAKIAHFNAERGMLGEGDVDDLVQKRLQHLERGKAYRVQRIHDPKTVIEIKGAPLPGGGYVTTFDDISEFISAQRELEEARDQLEHRVQQRTETIQEINKDLRKEIETRKVAEAQLQVAKLDAESASKTKTDLLALASHDIMQPLNAASLFAEAITSDQLPDDKLLTGLRSSIDSASSTISTLMEISKIDKGGFKPNIDSVEVASVFAMLREEFRILLKEPRKIRFADTSLWVLADRSSLSRIVQNFISNAVKYGDGDILVGCRLSSGRVKIAVYDQGDGISERDLNAVFGDFYRVDRHKKIEGVGLGLSVTKRLSAMMNGEISVRSIQGKGSCFSVSLPKVERQDSKNREYGVTAHKLEGLRVLCVDDEQSNLDALTQILERWSCDIRLADDRESALEVLEKFNPEILLMDYQLSATCNGLDLAEELLEASEEEGFAVCIVSGAALDDLRSRASARGFSFIPKPVKPAKLLAFLSSCNYES